MASEFRKDLREGDASVPCNLIVTSDWQAVFPPTHGQPVLRRVCDYSFNTYILSILCPNRT